MKSVTLKERFAALLTSLIFPAIFLGVQVLVGAVLSFVSGMMATMELMRFGTVDEAAAVELALKYAEQNVLPASAASGLVTVGVIALWLVIRKRSFRSTLRIHALPVRHSACALGLGVGMYITVGHLLSVIPLPESMLEEYNVLVAEQMTGVDPLMSVVTLVLVAPLAEELTFRGMCGGALERAFPAWAVILWQGAIFALIHMVPYQILYVFPVGIVLGIVYFWSGSMLAPLLMHAAFNAMGIITGLLDPAVLESPAVLLAGPVLVVGCLAVLYRTRSSAEE